jgi:hypothetical protein
MRSRALPALIGVAALTIATALTGTASAATAPSTSATGSASAERTVLGKACKGAANLGASQGVGLTAQDFEAAYDQYDAMGAADFKPKATCKVKAIYIEGSTVSGFPTAFNWAINEGSPDGKTVKKCSGKAALDGSSQSFKFPVKKGCKLKKNKTYWLTGNAQLDFATGGQWYWETTLEDVGADDQWQNPGGGFGVGCTTWSEVGGCLGYPGSEWIFAIQKSA